MREYFKKEPKKNKFRTFCKSNDADYMDDGYAVWIKPKRSKNVDGRLCDIRTAIKLLEDGRIEFGHMEETCLNFIAEGAPKVPETQGWIIETLTKIQKYHSKKNLIKKTRRKK